MAKAQASQAKITRAIKAMKAAGEVVGRVELALDGTLTVYSINAEIDEDELALSEWSKCHARKD